MSGAIECPSCGAPATEIPADPRLPIACSFCGARYERVTAEAALAGLRAEVTEWLQKTAGVAVSEGAASVDVATRTFLFNDRILPGLRRDVRRAIDEQVGDVLGAPILTPRILSELSGFRGEDGVLVSMRNAILALRSLRARIESDDVGAFATTAADRMALASLQSDIDHALFASNAAWAIASDLASGIPLAKTNLEVLSRDPPSTLLATVDPAAAMLASATRDRCRTLIRVLDEVTSARPSATQLQAAATRLEELSHALLVHESRSLRSALASTGIVRDATAVRVLAAVVSATKNSGLPFVPVLDAMGLLSGGLSEVSRPKDASYLVHTWSAALAAAARGVALPALTDTSWVNSAVEAVRAKHERPNRVDVLLEPFWAFSVRHSKAEGIFFVSGRQYEGMALVPASAHSDGTLLLPSGDPLVVAVQHAVSNPAGVQLPIDLAQLGPDTARSAARAILRARDLRNVSLGDPSLVYLPVAMTELVGQQGARGVAIGPRGILPHDPRASMARAQTLGEVRRRVSAAMRNEG